MSSKATWSLIAMVAVAFFLIWNMAHAATYTYTATSGSTNNWADTSKWTSATVPGVADDAIVNGTLSTCSINTNTGPAASVNTLVFNGATNAANACSLAIPITVANGATFNKKSLLESTLTGNATFASTSANNGGTITGNAIFNDSSAGGGTINGNATFNDASYFQGTTGGDVTLNTTCYGGVLPTGGAITIDGNGACGAWLYPSIVGGTLYGSDAQEITSFTFINGASADGAINGTAVFNDTSFTAGNDNMTGTFTFNDNSENYSPITGDATFYDNSYHSGETITGNATFYEDATEDSGATVTGTKTRHFTASVATTRDFTTAGPWTVIADGPTTVVTISGATYDGTTTFTCINGGTFSPDPGCAGGGTAPTVTTQAASAVSGTTATANGNITATGSANVTVRGFAYSTSATLATVIATTTDTTGQPFSTGAFTGALSSLTCETTYYARAYATNSVGTAFGSIQSFTTTACPTTGGGGANRPKTPSVLPPTATADPSVCFLFLTDLEQGMTSKAVRKLQQFLNAHGYPVSTSGIGSLGKETYYFGVATERALARFQEAYAKELLSPEGLTKGNGKLKSKTRKKTNQFFVNACSQTGTPIPSVSDPLVPLPEEEHLAEIPPHQSTGWFIDDTETNRPSTEVLTPLPPTPPTTIEEEPAAPPASDQPAEGGPVLDTGEVIDDRAAPGPSSPENPAPPTDRGSSEGDQDGDAPIILPPLSAILGTSTQAFLRTNASLVAVALAPVADLIAPIGLAISLGALVGTAVPIAGIPQSADVAVSLKRFWDVLLAALNIRKRRPWGVVYDSVTKRPLDPATVILTDEFGKKVSTSYTDLDGRYGFVVPPGTYRLEVTKTNYVFPSRELDGRSTDEVYTSLYFGGLITIKDNGTILNNIPLDPVGLDWKEIAAQNTKHYRYYSERARILALLTLWAFRIGFLLALYAAATSRSAYDLGVFAVYLVVGILRLLGLGPRPYGVLRERGTRTPLAYALVRVQNAVTGDEVVRTVADNLGRYYALVDDGRYVVEVERKEADASYTKAYVSPVLRIKHGIVNTNLVI